MRTGYRPKETFEQLRARVAASACLMPLTPEEKDKPKREKRSKRGRLLSRAGDLQQSQLKQLVALLENRAMLLGGYVVKRVQTGWEVEATEGGYGPHTVSLDLAECSCPDCRLRGHHPCKHITLLEEAGLAP